MRFRLIEDHREVWLVRVAVHLSQVKVTLRASLLWTTRTSPQQISLGQHPITEIEQLGQDSTGVDNTEIRKPGIP
jgi:hypothetical protein